MAYVGAGMGALVVLIAALSIVVAAGTRARRKRRPPPLESKVHMDRFIATGDPAELELCAEARLREERNGT